MNWYEKKQTHGMRVKLVTDEDKCKAYLADTDWYLTRFSEIGTAIPSEVSLKRLEARFQGTASNKLGELTLAYSTANQDDVAYLGTTFQADKASQDVIIAVLSAGSVPAGFFWVDAANVQVPMTYTELQGLSGAILERGQINFAKLQTLKAQVIAATTQAELSAIVW